MTGMLERFLAGRQALLLAILLGMVWGFWSSPLYDLDEGAFTEATREMMVTGNYTSIYLNGEPRHDKPILIYWLQAASAHVFGLNEFSLRLPSVLASLGWIWILFAFARRHTDEATARVAVLLLSLSLYVGLIAKAAVADALLNFFLAAAMFDIYSYYRNPDRMLHLRIFVWMGLGFLTKGPVAVFFPVVVSAAFYLSYGQWRAWLRAVLDPLGLLIFVAIVLPWHVAVYLDSGWAFFEGFYLEHNVQRYSGAMEGHGGSPLYFVLVAPLVIMPFAGWFLANLKNLPLVMTQPLDRYLWLWFFSVLLVFSFSGTKLPHYLLYGMSGVLLLMALYRDRSGGRLLNFVPVVGLLGFFALLPQVFAYAEEKSRRLYEKSLFEAGVDAFSGMPQGILLAVLVIALLIMTLRLSIWRRMLLIGLLQALVVATMILPMVLGVMQNGPREAALYAKEQGRTLVFNRSYQPSMSVYSEQIIPRRDPLPGEWVYVRKDKLDAFMQKPMPYSRKVVFSHTQAYLVEIGEADKDQ